MDRPKFRAVFAFIMAALMVGIVTFTLGAVRIGFGPSWWLVWVQNWLIGWPVAAVSIFLLSPFVRRWTARLIA